MVRRRVSPTFRTVLPRTVRDPAMTDHLPRSRRQLLLLSLSALVLLTPFPRAAEDRKAAEEKPAGKLSKDLLAAVDRRVEAEKSDLEALYKQLHAGAELSLAEVKTSARLAEELKKVGFTV